MCHSTDGNSLGFIGFSRSPGFHDGIWVGPVRVTNELIAAEAGSSGRWKGSHVVVLASVLLLGLGLGWQERSPDITIGGDEATYVALSHSLAHGHYRDEFLMGTPPHPQYPPGNAAWLLLVRSLGGPDLDLVRLANLLLLALTAVLTGDAVRRLASPWAGVGAAAAIVLHPYLLEFSGTVVSEIPYVALVTLSMWACLRADRGGGSRWELFGYAAALAAFLTRLLGVSALGAIVATYLIRRRWRAAMAAGAGAIVAAGGWAAYLAWAGQQTIGHTYAAEIAARAPGAGRSALERGLWYLRTLPAFYRLPTIEGTPIDNVVWYLILFGCGGVGLWVLARKWPVLALTLVGSFLILARWIWGVERLFLPLLPGGIAVLMVGAHTLGQRRGPKVALLAAGSLAVLLSASALVHHAGLIKRRNCDRKDPYGPRPCFARQATRLVAAARFAGQTLPADAILATSKPSTVYHFGNRRTFPLDVFLSAVRQDSSRSIASFGFTHVVLSEILTSDWKRVAPRLYRECDLLRVVAEFPPATVLLSVGEADTSDGAACRYLAGRLGKSE